MAHALLIAFGLVASASQPAPDEGAPANIPPPGSPATRYCLRIEPIIGSRIETIRCKTRDEWARLEIDVDQEWAENGVRVEA
jgi:hypothetical protein